MIIARFEIWKRCVAHCDLVLLCWFDDTSFKNSIMSPSWTFTGFIITVIDVDARARLARANRNNIRFPLIDNWNNLKLDIFVLWLLCVCGYFRCCCCCCGKLPAAIYHVSSSLSIIIYSGVTVIRTTAGYGSPMHRCMAIFMRIREHTKKRKSMVVCEFLSVCVCLSLCVVCAQSH